MNTTESGHLTGCPEDNSERASKCSERLLYGMENTLIPCYCICNKVLPVDPVTWSRDQFQSSDIATWWEVQCNATTAIYLLIYLKLGSLSFPFPFSPHQYLCCACLCIHGLFLAFVCIRMGVHVCACVQVSEDPRSAWRILLQYSSTFSQSNPEFIDTLGFLASWLWWSLSVLSGAEIVGRRPHPPGIYRGFWGFELWSLRLHNKML